MGAIQRMYNDHFDSVCFWGVVALGWLGLVYTIVETYHDNSYLLLIASYIQMCGFLIVSACITAGQNVHGLSVSMMTCYAMSMIARWWSIAFYDQYVPGDEIGEHTVFRVIEALSLGFVLYIIYLARFRYEFSYDVDLDSMRPEFLALAALLVAIPFHPNANDDWSSDVAWTFALYLESVSCLPQLHMFQQKKQARPYLSHFIVTITIARLTTLVFWSSWLSTGVFFMRYICGSVLLHVVLMGDFIYNYAVAIRNTVVLPILLYDI